jgi:uncharacterized protein YlxP (DUF503 family)
MVIGLLSFEIFLPYAQSLKDKRRIMSAFKDRIKGRFNVAVAELDYQDKWQRGRFGIVTLNSQKIIVDQVLQKILDEAEQSLGAEITQAEIQYF